MRMACYVFYKIDPAAESELLIELRRLQSTLAERTGVRGRVLRRDDASHTWMEAYEGVEQREVFEQSLSELVGERRLERFLAAGERRHVERFVECA